MVDREIRRRGGGQGDNETGWWTGRYGDGVVDREI